jgi:glucose-1-phosphate cytidylyltransferase
MVEIGGRPILWHIMKHYAHYGFRDFILCLGYKGSVIKDYFVTYETRNADLRVRLGERSSVKVLSSARPENWSVTLVETGATAQTGARLRRAARYLPEGPFFMTYGDGLSTVDLRALLAFHRAHGRAATVTGVRPTSRFGELAVRGRRVTSFAEKPLSQGLVSGGFFVFEKRFAERLSRRDNLILEREPLQDAAQRGELFVREHRGFWQPMDTYRDWKALEDLWATGRAPWKVWKD